MKKWTIVFSLILALLLGLPSVVSAQDEQPPTPEDAPPGWRIRQFARHHPAWLKAFTDELADRLGLTLDELKTRVKNGETPLEIAQSQGISAQEFRELLTETREDLLNQALADGKITPEQADAIRQSWENAAERRSLLQELRQQGRALLAEKLGLNLDEIKTRIGSGETLLEIAQAQGFSKEELQDLRAEVQQQVLEEAVAGGTLTQEQADRIQDYLDGHDRDWRPPRWLVKGWQALQRYRMKMAQP